MPEERMTLKQLDEIHPTYKAFLSSISQALEKLNQHPAECQEKLSEYFHLIIYLRQPLLKN